MADILTILSKHFVFKFHLMLKVKNLWPFMLHLFKNFNKVKLYSLYYVSICTYMVVKNMYFKSQNKTLRVRGNLV